MRRHLYYKVGIIVATVLVCLYGIVGLPKSQKELVDNFNNNIKLGLDLKGGSQLVVQVQVQDAFRAEADQVIERLRDEFRKGVINYGAIDRNDPQTLADAGKIEITVKGLDANKTREARTIITEQLGQQWDMGSVGSDLRLTLKKTAALALRRDTLNRALSTIEKRINALGVAESSVQQRGRSEDDSELLIQLPGVDDPARIKQIIQTAAMLELFPVKEGPFQGREQMMSQFNGVLPPGTVALQSERSAQGGESWYLLERSPVVTGRDVRDSRASQDPQTGRWETSFVLSQDGARRFERYTEANIGKQLAIVLDKRVRSAPTIESKISDNGRITGAGDQQAAADLALVLKAGSLPASLQYLEERSVGPSLGADSIRQGLVSGIAGLIAVIAAMLIYYKKAGINASLALILNAVILIAALAYFGAVLTLPGIAGIVLLIGMAVDSNVLIFERIREELASGKGPSAAVAAGFGKAFLTIVDTHVTTVVSCLLLFVFGTTQVKGFAVSLVLGLLANVFTAVFVSRVIFDWELSGKKVEKLSI
ncbi:MAG: protein translocase subunit SecD [Bryobacteraceae bacterium]|nr:protein translocase subunit SecD [Bryobacteraceae bacterium]